jgi:hypothetical protein
VPQRDSQKAPARWDTGVPHAVPGRPRALRLFSVSLVPAALAVVGVGVLAWSAGHSTSRRPSQAAAAASALSTATLVTGGLSAPPRPYLRPRRRASM